MPKGVEVGLSGSLQAEAQNGHDAQAGRVRPLAEDAVLITPVTIREKPTAFEVLCSQGTMVKRIPYRKSRLRSSRRKWPRFPEALANRRKKSRAPAPGDRTSRGSAKDTPGNDPTSDFHLIDAISGNKREAIALPTHDSRFASDTFPPCVDHGQANSVGV